MNGYEIFRWFIMIGCALVALSTAFLMWRAVSWMGDDEPNKDDQNKKSKASENLRNDNITPPIK